MLATIHSAALQGIEAEAVLVEVNTGEAGAPDAHPRRPAGRRGEGIRGPRLLRAQQQRLSHAAHAHDHQSRAGRLRKEGPLYDLPIALGILRATGQLTADHLGRLPDRRRTQPLRRHPAGARRAGHRAAGEKPRQARPASASAFRRRRRRWSRARGLSRALARRGATVSCRARWRWRRCPAASPPTAPQPAASGEAGGDFSEVKGQQALRRAVEVAVAGAHNLLMIGPPGRGQIDGRQAHPDHHAPALARRVSRGAQHPLRRRPHAQRRPALPVAAPTARRTTPSPTSACSAAAPSPARAKSRSPTTACCFSTSCPEFKRSALEVMRQPLEDGQVTISRSAGKVTLPCSFMLVAAMNPCACGYLGDPRHECRCTPAQIQRYRARISGPLLDRIDLHVEAPSLTVEELRQVRPGESSAGHPRARRGRPLPPARPVRRHAHEPRTPA